MENVMAEVFLDTQRLLWENEELRCRTWSAVMSTRVYPENFDTTRVMGTHPVKISVTCESIPAAARRFAESGNADCGAECGQCGQSGRQCFLGRTGGRGNFMPLLQFISMPDQAGNL